MKGKSFVEKLGYAVGKVLAACAAICITASVITFTFILIHWLSGLILGVIR